MRLPAAGRRSAVACRERDPSHAQQPFRPSGAPAADNLTVETVASGLAISLGDRLPSRWPDAGHRARRPPAHRRQGGNLSPPVAGVPPVFARGQGGLHDVILDREFAKNSTIYFCFAMPVSGGGQTALARARLVDGDRAAAR